MPATNFSPSPNNNTVNPPTEAEPWGEVYTMPQNFQPAVLSVKKTNHLWWWVGGAVMLLVVGLVLYFWGPLNSSNNTSSVNNNTNINNNNPPATEPPPVENPPAPVTTTEERDRMRYLHVNNLYKGLADYFAVQKKYPIAVLPLILGTDMTNSLSTAGFSASAVGTTYLSSVPANPSPGGSDYIYFSADGSTYSLKFALEQGVAGFNVGDHELTPRGIDVALPSTPPVNPVTPRTFQPPSLTIDTDQDGLTDAEEVLLKLDINKPDTDNDGYLDGVEVQNLYDPLKPDTARLINSAELATYTSQRFGYVARYPIDWTAKADTDETEVLLTPSEGEFFEVLVVENPEQLSASAWYARQVSGLKFEEVPTQSINNITWAMSLDGLNAYVASGRYIITFSYNIGSKTQASYYNLFKSLLKLFIVPPLVNSD